MRPCVIARRARVPRNHAAPLLPLLAEQYGQCPTVRRVVQILFVCVVASLHRVSCGRSSDNLLCTNLPIPGYCALWLPALATSPGVECVPASTGTGAGTGGAISSQSVTLVVCAVTGDSSLVAVTFSSVVSARTASGADAIG